MPSKIVEAKGVCRNSERKCIQVCSKRASSWRMAGSESSLACWSGSKEFIASVLIFSLSCCICVNFFFRFRARFTGSALVSVPFKLTFPSPAKQTVELQAIDHLVYRSTSQPIASDDVGISENAEMYNMYRQWWVSRPRLQDVVFIFSSESLNYT